MKIKKNTLYNLFSIIFLSFIFVQCTIVSGNGNVVTKEFKTDDYDKVVVDGSMDVELTEGKEGRISVEAEENIMEYIIIVVKDGTLTIDTKDGVGFSTTKGIKVIVPVEEISSVNLDGSGDIRSNTTLKTNNFKAELNGSGNLELELKVNSASILLDGSGNISLSGSSDQLTCELDGSGNIDALAIKVKEVKAELDGSGNMNIPSGQKLEINLDGSGNVQYQGNPNHVQLNNEGSGNISKL